VVLDIQNAMRLTENYIH